jgi:hypothetical protein
VLQVISTVTSVMSHILELPVGGTDAKTDKPRTFRPLMKVISSLLLVIMDPKFHFTDKVTLKYMTTSEERCAADDAHTRTRTRTRTHTLDMPESDEDVSLKMRVFHEATLPLMAKVRSHC